MRDMPFWAVVLCLFALLDFGAFQAYEHFVAAGVIAPIGSVLGRVDPPRDRQPVALAPRGAPVLVTVLPASKTGQVALAAGQRCVGGVVVDEVRRSDGSAGVMQPLEFGQPIRCQGTYRAP